MLPNPEFPADLVNLLKKCLMKNFIFCAVKVLQVWIRGLINGKIGSSLQIALFFLLYQNFQLYSLILTPHPCLFDFT